MDIEDDLEGFELIREGYSTLASNFTAAFNGINITKSEWSTSDKCRRYIKVLTGADITSGDERTIDDNISKDNIQSDRVRKYEWAVQGKLISKNWTMWCRVLKVILASYQRVTVVPVDKWINKIHEIHSIQWTWWWGEDTNPLYQHTNGCWHTFRPIVI